MPIKIFLSTRFFAATVLVGTAIVNLCSCGMLLKRSALGTYLVPSSVVVVSSRNSGSSSMSNFLRGRGGDGSKLAFTRENMLDVPNHRCGTWKCLYPLKHYPNVGYVAGEEELLEITMLKGWQFSQDVIVRQYGMEHVYRAPPITASVDPDFAHWLDVNKTGTDDKLRPDTPQFANRTKLTVQLVDIMDAAVFFGGSQRKVQLGWAQAVTWMQTLSSAAATSTTEREQVLDRFSNSVAKLYALLDDHPCLYMDFQIFVRKDGELVHLDPDRCFQNDQATLQVPGMAKQMGSRRRIERFAEFVMDMLRTGEIPADLETMHLFAVAEAIADSDSSLCDERLRFAQENMLEDSTHRCGSYKCLYPLKDHPGLGYVAGTRDILEASMWTAYNFSRNVIEAQYGMRHLSLTPPETIEISPQFGSWLDRNKTGSNDKPRQNVPHFADHATATVQLVDIISLDTALFYGCSDKKMIIGWSQMERWLAPMLSSDEKKRSTILERFQDSSERLFRLLEDHPCVYYDFQVFIRNSGEIVHFDMDRCFQTEDLSIRVPGQAKIDEYRGRIHNFVDFVIHTLQTGKFPATAAASRETLSVSNKDLVTDLRSSTQDQDSALKCNDKNKCQLSHPSDSELSFIVAAAASDGEESDLELAWDFTQRVIEGEYGMSHVYRSSPQRVESDDVNKAFHQALAGQTHPAAITVQLVDTTQEESSVMFGCSDERLSSGWNQLKKWLQSVTEGDLSTTSERMRILHNFERSSAQLLVLMRYNPCLHNDFHVMITKDGTIVHDDVDRCYRNGILLVPEVEEQEICTLSIKKMAQLTSEALRRGKTSSLVDEHA